MSLFQQGRQDEARERLGEIEARMAPRPADAGKPPRDGEQAAADERILRLVHREAGSLLQAASRTQSPGDQVAVKGPCSDLFLVTPSAKRIAGSRSGMASADSRPIRHPGKSLFSASRTGYCALVIRYGPRHERSTKRLGSSGLTSRAAATRFDLRRSSWRLHQCGTSIAHDLSRPSSTRLQGRVLLSGMRHSGAIAEASTMTATQVVLVPQPNYMHKTKLVSVGLMAEVKSLSGSVESTATGTVTFEMVMPAGMKMKGMKRGTTIFGDHARQRRDGDADAPGQEGAEHAAHDHL